MFGKCNESRNRTYFLHTYVSVLEFGGILLHAEIKQEQIQI